MFIGAENLRPYLMAAVANSLYNWALIFSVLKEGFHLLSEIKKVFSGESDSPIKYL
jgi:hypothetical protein